MGRFSYFFEIQDVELDKIRKIKQPDFSQTFRFWAKKAGVLFLCLVLSAGRVSLVTLPRILQGTQLILCHLWLFQVLSRLLSWLCVTWDSTKSSPGCSADGVPLGNLPSPGSSADCVSRVTLPSPGCSADRVPRRIYQVQAAQLILWHVVLYQVQAAQLIGCHVGLYQVPAAQRLCATWDSTKSWLLSDCVPRGTLQSSIQTTWLPPPNSTNPLVTRQST